MPEPALVNDLDSHEFIPAHLWEEFFGPSGAEAKRCWDALYAGDGAALNDSLNSLRREDVTDDSTPIDPDIVWTIKGCSAPGAIDMRRRTEVLDAMRVGRQLIFPNFGFFGMGLASMSDEYFDRLYARNLSGPPVDHREVGLGIMRAHNDWLLGAQRFDPRLHFVAVVPTFDHDEMMAEARRVLDGGARCLWLPATVPPGGTSPANERMDPLWSLAQERDVPVVLHIGTEPFLNVAWGDAPRFRRDYKADFPTSNPYFMTVFSFAPENFLATMILGGVFDRHPRLRFGVIECGGSWIGPLVDRMDLFVDLFEETRTLERRPMDYVADQVRVTPFLMEPVAQHLERYPALADVYCFSSDYPHVEGGQHAKEVFARKLDGLGDEVREKFFRANAELLLPGPVAAVPAPR